MSHRRSVIKKSDNRFVSFYFDRYMLNALKQPLSHSYFRHMNADERQALIEPYEFIENSSLEEKLLMLQKMGHTFALVMAAPQRPPDATVVKKLVDWFYRQASWKRPRAIKYLRTRLLFVLSDTEFMKGLRLTANLCNSPAAASFAGYDSIAKRLYDYKYEAAKTIIRDGTAGRAIDRLIYAAVTVSQVQNVREGFENLYGIDERQYVVLSLLSSYGEMSVADLQDKSGFRQFEKMFRFLINQQYVDGRRVRIDTKTDDTKMMYWITGLGEQVLLKARNYFLQHL